MHGQLTFADAVNWDCSLTRGLVSWWTCLPSQQRGVYWRDLCNRNHGVLTSMDTATDWLGPQGRPGGFGCLGFDAINDYVLVPAPAGSSLDIGTTHTLSQWLYATGSSSVISLCRFSWNGTTHHDLFFWLNSTTFTYSLRGSVTPTVQATWPGLNQWVHVTGTYDGSTASLYFNGVLVNSASTSTTASSNSEPWLIGADADATGGGSLGNYWPGFIDDTKIFSGLCKTPSEVLALHNDSRLSHPRMLNWQRRRAYSIPAGGGGGGANINLLRGKARGGLLLGGKL